MFRTDQPYVLTHAKLRNVSNELKPFGQIIQSSIFLMEVWEKKSKIKHAMPSGFGLIKGALLNQKLLQFTEKTHLKNMCI